MKATVASLIGSVLVVTGCFGNVTNVRPDGTERPLETQEPIYRATVGVPVVVTEAGEETLRITVKQTAFSRGLEYQEPSSGNIFFAIEVEYVSLKDGAYYSSGDWEVYSDGTKKGNSSFVMNDSWEPYLSVGDLPQGRSISGWVTFETPRPDSSMTISYRGNQFVNERPVFELTVSCCR
jgi:hypothetical protein